MGELVHPLNGLKPWYLYRPQQMLLRLARSIIQPQDPFQVLALPWGCRIKVDIRQPLGHSIWTTGLYDLAVSEALFRLVVEGDLTVDVGANIGYMTGLMGVRAGSSGEVWSFEPHPALYQALADNLERFVIGGSFACPRLFNCALSDSKGHADLVCPADFDHNNGLASLNHEATGAVGIFEVATSRLDDLVGDGRVGVLKVDVEGYESKVLAGAERLLLNRRIKYIIYEDHQGPSSEVHKLLSNFGYTVGQLGWTLSGPVLAPLDARSVHRTSEAPSYCASLSWEAAQSQFRARGWQVLRPFRKDLRLVATCQA